VTDKINDGRDDATPLLPTTNASRTTLQTTSCCFKILLDPSRFSRIAMQMVG
jgi:hypothetical protein